MARQSELSAIRVFFEPVLRRFFHAYWRVTRGLTIGVRALVIDGAGPRLSGQAQLRRRLASAGRRRRGGRDAGRRARPRIARGGQYRTRRAAASSRDLLQSPRFAGATMSRSMSCARSARSRRRSRTAKSSRTAFSRPMRCPRARPRQRVGGSPKYWPGNPSPNFGRSRRTALLFRHLIIFMSRVIWS